MLIGGNTTKRAVTLSKLSLSSMKTVNNVSQSGEVVLELMRQVVATQLDDYPFMKQSLEVVIRDSFERMGKQLLAFTNLPVEPLKEVSDVATFKTPKTWFDHFKATYFPWWLLRRFPIQWQYVSQTVTIKVGAVYPQLPEVYPRNLGEIRYCYYKPSPITSYPKVGVDPLLDD